VRIETLVLLIALVLAANLVLLVALQLPRLGRRMGLAGGADGPPTSSAGSPGSGTTPDGEAGPRRVIAGSSGLPPGLYQRMSRVVSLMFIGSALVLSVVTGSGEQTAVIVLLAFGLILIELFQDVLPTAAFGRSRMPLEAALVLVFVTVLIAMTGGVNSPYFFGYLLLVGAAALSTSEFGGVALAVTSSIAYLGAVVVGSGGAALEPEDLAVIAFNLIAIALVMYVAAVIGREQRRAREEALRLSRFDSLTRLHSRDYFMAELEQEILRATRTGRPFALAMVDLDGLKAANDRFGHDWGDNLLRAVADAMRGDIRITDVAARFGGDEFVLLLPETDLSGAILVAEKVRVDIARIALPHNGAVVRTTASIGIVSFPDDGRTSAELMRRADIAMYEAKRRGRDQIVRFARESAPPAPVLTTQRPPLRGGVQVPLETQPEAHVSTVAPQIDERPTPPVVAIKPAEAHQQPVPAAVPPRSAGSAVANPPAVPPASAGPAPWESS
jgi:diguanylate cyclase (GGDEF)-like protein